MNSYQDAEFAVWVPARVPVRELGEGWWRIPESLFIMAGVLHHQILIREDDMQSVVLAKGEQRNTSRVAANAEEE